MRIPEDRSLIARLVGQYRLSQREIARRIGVHETAISQWRNGWRQPTTQQLAALRQLAAAMRTPSELRAAEYVERIARARGLWRGP
jgi:transcriptional regulator with XRE-family HTH domain